MKLESMERRLYWGDKGEILPQSAAIDLSADELADIAPYAVVPDDIWEFLREEFLTHGPGRVKIIWWNEPVPSEVNQ